MPVSQRGRRDRRCRAAAGVRHSRARDDSACRAAAVRRRAVVPFGAPVVGGAATDGPALRARTGAPADRQESGMTATRPYYVPVGNEEQVFTAAFRQGLSVLLKGPTGCGKT